MTPLATNKLAPSEVAVMKDLQGRCCGNNSNSEFCKVRPAGPGGNGSGVMGAFGMLPSARG